MDDSFYVTYWYTSLRNFVKTMCSPNCIEQCTLTQYKLSSLSILNIEFEELNDMNYDEIIDKFADLKSRKKVI